MRRLLIPLLCGLWAACGPYTAHYQKDPSRQSLIEVIGQSGQQFITQSGQPHDRFEAIATAGIVFSPDGQHLAYPAQQDGRWHMIRDRQKEAAWDGLATPRFSPDGRHLAYAGRRGGSWQVVIDGRPGEGFDAILADSLVLSQDGRHHAYVASRGSARYVVYDGQLGRAYDGIAQLQLSPNGEQAAYLARSAASAWVICGSRVFGPYSHSAELRINSSGDCAHISKHDQQWRVYYGIHQIGAYDSAAGLLFNSQGELSFVARRGDYERVVHGAVMDPIFSQIDFRSLRYMPGRNILGYIARSRHSAEKLDSPGRTAQAVINGVPQPSYIDISNLQLSPEHFGYVATLTNGQQRVIIDNTFGPTCAAISDFQLHPYQASSLYVTSRGPRAVIHAPNSEHDYTFVLPGSLSFSSDGRHWGAIAGDHISALYFVLDGELKTPFHMDELYRGWLSGQVAPTATESVLRSWVKAELAAAFPP